MSVSVSECVCVSVSECVCVCVCVSVYAILHLKLNYIGRESNIKSVIKKSINTMHGKIDSQF